MDPELVFLFIGDTLSYCIIGWIVFYCHLDRIASLAGSYCIGWIGSHHIGWIRKHWLLCAGWLLSGQDGWGKWTGWGIGGTGVGRTDISTRRNGSATMGAGTGAPPLDLEGHWAIGSGVWHQFLWCCKYMDHLCWRSKIIQIECTRIGTNKQYNIV